MRSKETALDGLPDCVLLPATLLRTNCKGIVFLLALTLLKQDKPRTLRIRFDFIGIFASAQGLLGLVLGGLELVGRRGQSMKKSW